MLHVHYKQTSLLHTVKHRVIVSHDGLLCYIRRTVLRRVIHNCLTLLRKVVTFRVANVFNNLSKYERDCYSVTVTHCRMRPCCRHQGSTQGCRWSRQPPCSAASACPARDKIDDVIVKVVVKDEDGDDGEVQLPLHVLPLA